eukprot:m.52999 g.52999  ORF g.52999 m.52999 type:complete len:388 (+) comp7649_c3_seq2:148-1311(+)
MMMNDGMLGMMLWDEETEEREREWKKKKYKSVMKKSMKKKNIKNKKTNRSHVKGKEMERNELEYRIESIASKLCSLGWECSVHDLEPILIQHPSKPPSQKRDGLFRWILTLVGFPGMELNSVEGFLAACSSIGLVGDESNVSQRCRIPPYMEEKGTLDDMNLLEFVNELVSIAFGITTKVESDLLNATQCDVALIDDIANFGDFSDLFPTKCRLFVQQGDNDIAFEQTPLNKIDNIDAWILKKRTQLEDEVMAIHHEAKEEEKSKQGKDVLLLKGNELDQACKKLSLGIHTLNQSIESFTQTFITEHSVYKPSRYEEMNTESKALNLPINELESLHAAVLNALEVLDRVVYAATGINNDSERKDTRLFEEAHHQLDEFVGKLAESRN